MPRIPKANFNRGISSDVGVQPTQSLSEASRSGRSLQALGQGVSNLGRGLTVLEQNRQKAEDDTFIQEDRITYRAKKVARERELRQKMDGTDAKGYAQAQQEWIKEQKQLALDKADSKGKQEYVKRFYDTEAQASLADDSSYQNTQALRYRINQFEKSRKARENHVFEAASLKELSIAANEHLLDVQSSNVLSAKQKEDQLKLASNLTASTLDGMYMQGGQKLLEAKAFLEGKSAYKDELKLLDAKDRARFLQKVDNKLLLEKKKMTGLAVGQSKALVDAIGLSTAKSGVVNPLIKDQALKAIESLGKIGTPKALEAREDLKNALADVDFQNGLTVLTRDELNKMTDSNIANTVQTDSLLEAGSDLKQINRRINKVNAYKKRMGEDPGGLIASENPTIKQGTQEFLEIQKARGILSPRIFSNNVETTITETLKNSPNKAQALKEIQSQYPLANKGLAQMAQKDKSLAKFVLATEFTNPITRTAMLNINPKEINKSFDAADIAESATVKDAVNTSLEEFSKAYNRNDTFVNGMREITEAMVKQEMIRSGSSDADEIAQNIVQKTFGSEYVIAKSKDSAILLSGDMRENQREIETFMDTYSNPKNLMAMKDDLGIKLENQINIVEGPAGTFKNEEEFLEHIIDSGLEYRLNNTRDGLIPVYTADNGATSPIFVEGEAGPIPLEVPFTDIVNGGRFNQVVLDKMNEPFFTGLKDVNPDAFKRLKANIEAQRSRNMKSLRTPSNE